MRPAGLVLAGTFLFEAKLMNAIYLRRRSKVILPEGAGATPINLIATASKNIEPLGYVLSQEVVDGLKGLNPIQVDGFYQRLVKELRALVGARRQWTPMYPNFPTQVMEMTAAAVSKWGVRRLARYRDR